MAVTLFLLQYFPTNVWRRTCSQTSYPSESIFLMRSFSEDRVMSALWLRKNLSSGPFTHITGGDCSSSDKSYNTHTHTHTHTQKNTVIRWIQTHTDSSASVWLTLTDFKVNTFNRQLSIKLKKLLFTVIEINKNNKQCHLCPSEYYWYWTSSYYSTDFLHVKQTKYFYFKMFFIMLAYYERNVILSQDTNIVITAIVHCNVVVW